MKLKELRAKSQEELEKLYRDFCLKRQEFSFKVANKQLKNVREFRDVKKTLATILTLLNENKKK